MKLSNIILSSVTLLLTIAAIRTTAQQTSCTTDYQCPATAPYGQCTGSLNDCTASNPGVAVDLSTNMIIYAQQCRGSSAFFGNTTIKQVSVNGGVPQTIYTEQVIPAAGNIGKILAAANGYVYFDRSQRAPGSLLVAYQISTGQSTTGGVGEFFQSELDITNGESLSVSLVPGPNGLSYEIDRYTAVIGQSALGTATKIYDIPAYPDAVRRGAGSDVVVFATYTVVGDSVTTTTFYRGTIAGSATLPPPYFTVNGYVADFDIDSTGNIVVYGTSSGLFKRVGDTTTTLSTESITGVYLLNNKVIYNNGLTIRSANLDGTGITDLIQPSSGLCSCRSGFSGSDCQTCENGQIQWNNGIPSCVPINAQGFPTTCSYDYQCGNVPYTLCTGSCTCRPNFTGNKCDQCASPRSSSFVNGIPYCS